MPSSPAGLRFQVGQHVRFVTRSVDKVNHLYGKIGQVVEVPESKQACWYKILIGGKTYSVRYSSVESAEGGGKFELGVGGGSRDFMGSSGTPLRSGEAFKCKVCGDLAGSSSKRTHPEGFLTCAKCSPRLSGSQRSGIEGLNSPGRPSGGIDLPWSGRDAQVDKGVPRTSDKRKRRHDAETEAEIATVGSGARVGTGSAPGSRAGAGARAGGGSRVLSGHGPLTQPVRCRHPGCKRQPRFARVGPGSTGRSTHCLTHKKLGMVERGQSGKGSRGSPPVVSRRPSPVRPRAVGTADMAPIQALGRGVYGVPSSGARSGRKAEPGEGIAGGVGGRLGGGAGTLWPTWRRQYVPPTPPPHRHQRSGFTHADGHGRGSGIPVYRRPAPTTRLQRRRFSRFLGVSPALGNHHV
ncbi:unnamed protein product, partial [Discosporangium mesarthrocarpum]